MGVGSQLQLDRVVVRDTHPVLDAVFEAPATFGGHGVAIFSGFESASSLNVRGSVFARNVEAGIAVAGGVGTVVGALVEDTRDRDGAFGRGVVVVGGDSPSPFSLLQSVVSRSHDVGISVHGARMNIDAVAIELTQPRPDGRFGIGVAAVVDAQTQERAGVDIRDSVLSGNATAGALVAGADLALTHSAITDTVASSFDGELQFGDGVVAMTTLGPAAVTIVDSLILDSDRTAVAVLDSSVSVAGTTLGCATLEPAIANAGGLLSLQGDTTCGCGGSAVLCEPTTLDLLAPPVPSKLAPTPP